MNPSSTNLAEFLPRFKITFTRGNFQIKQSVRGISHISIRRRHSRTIYLTYLLETEQVRHDYQVAWTTRRDFQVSTSLGQHGTARFQDVRQQIDGGQLHFELLVHGSVFNFLTKEQKRESVCSWINNIAPLPSLPTASKLPVHIQHGPQ